MQELPKIHISDLPKDLVYVRGWDLALTEKEVSDYSAGALLGYEKRTSIVYLVHMYRKKLAWPKLRKEIYELTMQDRKQYGCNRIMVEGVAGFLATVQELRSSLLGIVKVEKRDNMKSDKLERARPWFNMCEANKFVVVLGTWNKDFMSELEFFPSGDHDDQIDGVSMGIEALGLGHGKKLRC